MYEIEMLRTELNSTGESLRECAGESGIPASTLHRILKDDPIGNTKTYLALCAFLTKRGRIREKHEKRRTDA